MMLISQLDLMVQEEYGTKVEIKNINSFREVQKALEKEEERQKELYQFGEEYKIKQETRRWDALKEKLFLCVLKKKLRIIDIFQNQI